MRWHGLLASGHSLPRGTRQRVASRSGEALPSNPVEKALVLEDVVTTGKSLKETMEVVRAHGGEVVATGALVDRNPSDLQLDVPFSAIARLEFPTYDPSNCALCQSGSQPVKPGSRPPSAAETSG